MGAERLTEAALELVASSQQVATTRQHQQVTVLHLVAALVADGSGAPGRLAVKAGADLEALRQSIDGKLSRLPKVAGGNAQYMDQAMGKVFEAAGSLATELGDAFIAADTLLVAARRVGGADLDALPKADALF